MATTTTALSRPFVGDRVIAAWRAGSTPHGRALPALATFAAAATALSVAAARTAPVTAAALGTVLTLCGAAALVDLHEHRLPNQLLTGSLVGVGIAALATTIGGHPGGLGAAAAGLLLGGLPLLVVRLRRGLGMGDVKLAAVLGAAGGLVHPLVALATTALGALAAGTAGSVLRRPRLALGPWWWAAWVIATVLALHAGGGR